jgi:signal transduction histidine kinase
MSQAGVSLLEVLLVSMLGLFALGTGIIIIFMVHQRRLIAKDLEQQRMESHYQKELLKGSIQSQEAERQRIAHDLHDEIGALLTTSRMYFNQLEPGQPEEQLKRVSEKMNALFDEMISNVRSISHDLRPVVLEKLGLIEAIDSLREKLIDTGMGFHFSHQISLPLNKEAEVNLYRILQELVGNTLKHAHAKSISIQMKQEKNNFLLLYSDDGIGFDPAAYSIGLGIKSIESRVSVLDGKMKITQLDKGICFRIEIDHQRLAYHGNH